MAKPLLKVPTDHEDMIHDSQFDYYAKKLATCSSDRTIKIYDVSVDEGGKNSVGKSATLTGHEGPVWQVAWAHPKFGVILASCSYDGSVLIHREAPQKTWTKIFRHEVHKASVNSIAWAPHEFGLCLACASSDGCVSILHYKDDMWQVAAPIIENDKLGCNAVSWAPYSSVGSVSPDAKDTTPMKRLVTASCDNKVRIWQCKSSSGAAGAAWTWEEEVMNDADQHSDWVRDVAWAPNTAMPYDIIASCSEDNKVLIWTQNRDKKWTAKAMPEFGAPVWRVSWSITGNVLAVSTGDHKVSLWKQCVDESWTKISSIDE